MKKATKVRAKSTVKADIKFHKNSNLNELLVQLKKASKSESQSFSKKQKEIFVSKLISHVNY